MDQILKQTSWLFLAQAFGRIIGFFYTIFLARSLGVEEFGLISAALAYFSLFSVLADFGFNRFLIREVARDHLKVPELLCNISMLRLTFSSIIFAIFALVLYLLDPDKLRVSLILLATLTVIPQSVSLTLDAVYVALSRLQFSALSLVFLNVTTILIGVYLVNSGFGSIGAITALILGQLLYLILLGLIFKRQKLGVLSKVDWPILKKVLKGSLPYGFLGILGLLYFKVDTIILSYLKGNFEVGIYSAAYKFLEAVVFIPSSLSLALFPRVVRLLEENPARVYKLYLKVTLLLFVISLFITGAYIFILPTVFNNFLPQYLPAINVVQILSITIPFMFMISAQGVILFSKEKFLKALIFMSIFNLLLNVSLNIYLIPKFSYIGAAWATVISDIVGFVLFFLYISSKLARVR